MVAMFAGMINGRAGARITRFPREGPWRLPA